MGTQAAAPSRAARIGHGLVTVLLVSTAVFTALAVVSIVVGIARDGISLLYGHDLPVPAQVNPDDVRLRPGVELSGWPDVTLRLHDPTTEQMLLRSLMDLAAAPVFLAGLWQLRGITGSVLAGEPFGTANVTRLRRIGFLLVAGAPLVEVVTSQLRIALMNALPENRFGDIAVRGFTLPGWALLGGLGAFVLAEVFAHGLRLREDVEATI